MNLKLLTLFAALCFVAVAINAESLLPIDDGDDADADYVADDAEVEFSFFGKGFNGLYWVFRKVLKTLRGINCTIKGVVNVKNTAQQLIDDVQSCGVEVTKKVQNVINACQDIINTSNDIINLNENVCNNGDYNDEEDGSKKSSKECFRKLLSKLLTLRKQIKKAISLIKKVPQTPADTNQCVNTAMTKCQEGFNAFPSFVRSCSKFKQ